MKYRDRQMEVDWFMDGDEILRTFRGVGKKAFAAIKPFAIDHWRLQKTFSTSTFYNALRGEKSWDQIVDSLNDLLLVVKEAPRQYCEPPEIPNDWDAFRKTLLEYAPSPWWFDALKLDDLCKPTSWQSWMSRSTEPRCFQDIYSRAIGWRERVMKGLDAWELAMKEDRYWREILHFRVKDALDQGGEEAAWRAFIHLRGFEREPGYRGVFSSTVYDRRCFDPAEPERAPFKRVEIDESAVRPEFEELLRSGFPQYRDATPQPPRIRRYVTGAEWCSDDYLTEWSVPTEFEVRETWDPILRDFAGTKKVTRIKVRVPEKYAIEGEEVEEWRRRKYGTRTRSGNSWEDKSRWTYEYERFVWRWRDYDPDEDCRGGSEGRDKVMKIAGLNLEEDDPSRYMKQVRPPIEDRGEAWYSVE